MQVVTIADLIHSPKPKLPPLISPVKKAARVEKRASHYDLDPAKINGYTKGMKTAVSIPDDVFNEAEELAKELKTSRSEIYARALAAFVGDHSSDRVTLAMNDALDTVGTTPDPSIIATAHRILREVEW